MYQHITTCLMTNESRLGRRRAVSVKPMPAGEPAPEADIRHDLVARIRAEIAAGTYDTPERFAIAFDRMVDDVE